MARVLSLLFCILLYPVRDIALEDMFRLPCILTEAGWKFREAGSAERILLLISHRCKDMTEYSSYESIINYESIKAENSSPYTDVSVALYDIDQDGTKELILSHGTCLADWVNDIYTLKDGKLSCWNRKNGKCSV